jgi:serine/threonine protein kinase
MDHASFLKSLHVFRALPAESAQKLADRAGERRYAPGDRILAQGDPGDAMFIVQRGSVRVPIVNDEGTRFEVYLGPGDLFGEMALITGDARRADVYADGEVECSCLVFPAAEVKALLKSEPHIARFLTEIVGKRLLSGGQMKEVGKYQLLGELGRGGGAIVYKGYHPGLHRSVAVKMLSHDLVYEADFADQFVQEAQLIAELRHENIVQVYDIERAYATFFIVMERLDGMELSEITRDGPATPEETRHILRQLARALQYAHKAGVIHQDVKPSNVFVENSGRVKLMDFGIAGKARQSDHEQGVMGTPGYIAPEVLLGGEVDGRADIYALGVVGWEMLTGRTAFDAKSKVDILRQQLATDELVLPDDIATKDPELAAFITKATAKDPKRRFLRCGQVLEHLDEPDHLDPARVDGMTLTVIFDKRDRAEIEQLLGETAETIARIPGARVAAGDLSRFE